MEVRVLMNQDHEVLGSDYCSGFTDERGKWNTGFYCPSMGNGATVYCCGTATFKYCCTRKDENSTTVGVSQAVVLGSALGTVLMLLLVTLVSCLVCRRCLPYRRGHPSLSGGPLYSMHCSSTASGVANMYSFSGQNTAATTPMDPGDPHILVDLDCRHSSPNHVFSAANHDAGRTHQRGIPYAPRGGCRPHLPTDPPPPYHADNPVSSVLCSEQQLLNNPGMANLSNTTSFTQSSRAHQNTQDGPQTHRSSFTTVNNLITPEDNLYWSTKF